MARTTSSGKGFADTTGVRPQEVELQLFQLIRRDPDLGELAETGVDAVDNLSRVEDVLDHLARPRHLVACLTIESHTCAVTRDRLNPGNIESAAVNQHRFCHEFALSAGGELLDKIDVRLHRLVR